MKHLKNFVAQTFKDWVSDGAFRSSAALSFYVILALPALILSVITLTGMVLSVESAEHEVTRYAAAAVGKTGEEIISLIVPNESEPSFNFKKIFGLLVLIISASGIFGQLQTSLNQIWNIDLKPKRGLSGLRRTIISKLALFVMVLGLGALLITSLLVESAVAFGSEFISEFITLPPGLVQGLNLGLGFLLLVVVVSLIYKYVPDAKIGWTDVAIGALITALLFTAGKYAIGWYLSTITTASVYGAAGSLIILLSWIYYSALVFFLGAEFTQNYANTYGSGIVPDQDGRSAGSLRTFILKKLKR